MNERKSALDHLIEGNIFTNIGRREVTFDEYYQGVESIEVKFYESGEGTYGYERTLRNGQVSPIIRCSNRLCSNGGYEVERVIFEMIRNKDAHREVRMTCSGKETSPKGRRVYRDCENEASFVIDIQFKEQTPQTEQ